jgi:hypothetical protein
LVTEWSWLQSHFISSVLGLFPQFCIQHFLSHFHITWSSQKAWSTFSLFVCVPSQAPWQELRMEIYTLRTHDLIFMSVYIGNLIHKGKFLQCRQWEWATTWLAKKIQDCGGNSTGIGIFAWRVSNPYSPSWHQSKQHSAGWGLYSQDCRLWTGSFFSRQSNPCQHPCCRNKVQQSSLLFVSSNIPTVHFF